MDVRTQEVPTAPWTMEVELQHFPGTQAAGGVQRVPRHSSYLASQSWRRALRSEHIPMIPKWKPNSIFTIADSPSIITKHTQTMACAHRWRGRHCFWTPTTDPRGKTPPATPLYERTMDRSDCRYIVRLHLVQCVRRNQTKGQDFSFEDIFKK